MGNLRDRIQNDQDRRAAGVDTVTHPEREPEVVANAERSKAQTEALDTYDASVEARIEAALAEHGVEKFTRALLDGVSQTDLEVRYVEMMPLGEALDACVRLLGGARCGQVGHYRLPGLRACAFCGETA